jgi:hypothetical protein
MPGPSDLFALPISSSYNRIVQFVTGSIYDGTGSMMSSSMLTYRFEIGTKTGDGTAIPIGSKGIKSIDVNGTAVSWTLVSDVAATVSCSLWKSNKAIPTSANNIFTASLTSAGTQLGSGSINVAVAQGDLCRFEVMSNNSATYLFLEVRII